MRSHSFLNSYLRDLPDRIFLLLVIASKMRAGTPRDIGHHASARVVPGPFIAVADSSNQIKE